MPLSSSELATLRALLDRLIPADDFPGALAAGTDRYVLSQLESDQGRDCGLMIQGLRLLEAETAAATQGQVGFSTLSPAAQDALLSSLEANHHRARWPAALSPAQFLERFVALAHEGFYADPANGGNLGAASWKMLGYDPRLPITSGLRSASPAEDAGSPALGKSVNPAHSSG